MRKITKYLLLIIFLVIHSNSYSQWQKMFEIYTNINQFTGNSNYVFCATGPRGVFRSSDNGLTWDTVNSGLENKNAQTITAQGNYIFTYTDSGLFRSTNNGNNWNYLNKMGSYHLACNEQFVIGGTPRGMYRSSDHGITWDSINSGLPRQPFGGLPPHISAISISTNYIYIGIYASYGRPQIYRTSNYGDNWFPINYSGMDSISVYSLESKDSIVLCGTEKGVYISRNYSLSWRLIPEINHNIGLFGLSIIDERNIMIASYGYGVQVTTNGGENWNFRNEGINSGEYYPRTLFSIGGFSFLGTAAWNYLPAVFRRYTSQLIPVLENNSMIPKEIKLFQNYPNPFNPTTKINYALPKTGLVTMKIYDVIGREIQTLVNDVKQAGNFTVDFNGSSLSSGVYFYLIKSGDFVMTKRMVLIK